MRFFFLYGSVRLRSQFFLDIYRIRNGLKVLKSVENRGFERYYEKCKILAGDSNPNGQRQSEA